MNAEFICMCIVMRSIMHGYQFCRVCSYYLILHAQAVACMIIDISKVESWITMYR